MKKPYYKAETYSAGKSVVHLIRRASKISAPHIESVFAKQDITFVQYAIMMYIRDGIANTAAGIGQTLCYDSGALTRVIDNMEERGFIRRARSKQDRRVIELQLTALGRKTVQSVIPSIVDYYNRRFADFTHEEMDTLVHLLTRVISRFDTPPGE